MSCSTTMRWMGAIAIFAMSLQPVPSRAHTELLQAIPRPVATVSEPPAGISLTFTEEVDAAFSGLSLVNQKGGTIDLKELRIEGARIEAIIAQPLNEGTYRVNWHLLSVDGHRVEGSFSFEFVR